MFDLVAASDIAVLGYADYTRAELEADLLRTDWEHVGWFGADGTLVGYGSVGGGAESPRVLLDLYVHPDSEPRCGLDMLETVESLALRVAAARGHDHADLDVGVHRQDERGRSWMRQRGFAVGTTFTRMGIDLADARSRADGGDAVTATGVEVMAVPWEESALRCAHSILEESFVEHYGHTATDYDHWRQEQDAAGHDWHALWLASVDGVACGALLANNQFVEDVNAGYVQSLGVLPAARGRGVAKALLRTYFAAAAAAGRTSVLLHVDQANVTNALELYESVGMRALLQIDAWAKSCPITPAPDRGVRAP